MLKFSSICLFICNLFLLGLFQSCQSGTSWEVSSGLVGEMLITSIFAALFFIISIGFFIFHFETYANIKSKIKYLNILWYLLVIILFAIILYNSGPVDAFRVYSLLDYTDIVMTTGLGIIILFLIILLLIYRNESIIAYTIKSEKQKDCDVQEIKKSN